MAAAHTQSRAREVDSLGDSRRDQAEEVLRLGQGLGLLRSLLAVDRKAEGNLTVVGSSDAVVGILIHDVEAAHAQEVGPRSQTTEVGSWRSSCDSNRSKDLALTLVLGGGC